MQQIIWDHLLCDEVYQQKTDKDCGMFCCLNAYFFLNGYSRYQDEDSLAVRYWIPYQCNRFHFEFQRMKEKLEFDENEFFEILSISRDIQIKNLSSQISPKDRRPSHYENVFKDIKALFFSKNIEETVPSPSQGLDSGNEETDNEYDKNEENYENEKIAIMAKFKSFFDVYRDTFFSHVEKLMKGEISKMQSYRFKVWTRTTNAFFQRKAEEESEI